MGRQEAEEEEWDKARTERSIVKWIDCSDDEQEGQEGPAEVDVREEIVSGLVEMSKRETRGERKKEGRGKREESEEQARREREQRKEEQADTEKEIGQTRVTDAKPPGLEDVGSELMTQEGKKPSQVESEQEVRLQRKAQEAREERGAHEVQEQNRAHEAREEERRAEEARREGVKAQEERESQEREMEAREKSERAGSRRKEGRCEFAA